MSLPLDSTITLNIFLLLIRTSGSMDSNNESQEFSAELTLHSEVPKVISCSPANMIEVHGDKELHRG